MIKFKKTKPQALSAHFNSKEFNCTCIYPSCEDQLISEELIFLLEKVREEFGGPITITSGFRCKKRQRDLSRAGYQTARGTSPHELGLAADVRASDQKRLEAICDKHFKNVGIASTFTHVDVRPTAQKRRWKYV